MGNKSEEKVYIDLISYPLNSLGPDTRVGIWFQGCDIGCNGCISTYTWEQTEDKLMNIDELAYKLNNFKTKKLTISGGEPFNQAKGLQKLLVSIRKKFDDILIYSGYEYEYLQQNHSSILQLVDVLIDGPFLQEEPTQKIYKGSKNQRMYIFNNNLIKLYKKHMTKTNRKLQLHIMKNQQYILGIPDINDSKKIQKILNGEY